MMYRYPLVIMRGRDQMAHQRDKPTTNIASRERAAMRDAKRDIRVDDAKAVNGIDENGKEE
jgi:hypothetical protein